MKTFPGSAGYYEVDHTADIAIAVSGDSLTSLFQEALFAMREISGIKLQNKKGKPSQSIIEANSPESLLVAFLSEVIFLLEKNQWPEVSGLKIVENNLTFSFQIFHCETTGKQIKAVTYNQMEIIKHSGLVSTIVVFDV
jgi:SHS2 domain-containing protein